MNVDRSGSASEIGLDPARQPTLDVSDDANPLGSDPASPHIDRISLGKGALVQLARRSAGDVMIMDRMEDAHARIPLLGRTLALDDGIYRLL